MVLSITGSSEAVGLLLALYIITSISLSQLNRQQCWSISEWQLSGVPSRLGGLGSGVSSPLGSKNGLIIHGLKYDFSGAKNVFCSSRWLGRLMGHLSVIPSHFSSTLVWQILGVPPHKTLRGLCPTVPNGLTLMLTVYCTKVHGVNWNNVMIVTARVCAMRT